MFWYGPYMGGWAWGLTSLLFWLFLVAAGVMLVRWVVRGSRRPSAPYQGFGAPGPSGRAAAEQILAERFARGEIDEDEFWRRMSTLRAERPRGQADAGS